MCFTCSCANFMAACISRTVNASETSTVTREQKKKRAKACIAPRVPEKKRPTLLHWIFFPRKTQKKKKSSLSFYRSCGIYYRPKSQENCSQFWLLNSQSKLRWSHLYFIRMSAVHIIFICFIPFTGTMNSINWPASSQRVGLHGSVGGALQR